MASHLALQTTEVIGSEWTEACATLINGDGEEQELFMTPAEMAALYKRLKLYYEQGIWSMGTVND